MYNKCFLIGRLVRDPEMRVTLSGVTVTRFTLAIDRIRGKDGQESVTDFIRVVAWRRLAEICGEYLKKGKLVAIEGRLQVDSYEKDGETKTSADVIADSMQMLDRGIQQMEEHPEFASQEF
ncbi:MAG: single-stranded DNA-binding protein [Candidatus Margulisbacteria bacterium]|nr:single-stranded DNA-binding protein [Candidatus Margulisiibacteriota bacterium]